MNYFKNIFFLSLLFSFPLIVISQPSDELLRESKYETINYSDLKNWAAHPSFHNPSDSVPGALLNDISNNPPVDVFFIHPTTLTDQKSTQWNADINDEELNKKTDYSTILYQASVFNVIGKIYAPRYRQVHIRGFFSEAELVRNYFELAYQDVRNAFIYYLEHNNNGRPIIIASHSQGTWHAKRLLKEFFDGKDLQKKLVCAYIIGFPVEENWFSSISVCRDSTETGCFVTWRTFKSGYVPEFIKKENFQAVVVNPLSWKINTDYIGKNKNLGGVMYHFNKISPHVVDAKINGNILWSCKPDILGKIFIRNKNFHIGDINLFYINIRENVKCRVNQYFKIK